MAVLAFVGRIRKFQIGVAIAARDGGVATTERKAGLGVIELDLALYNLPIRRGVAIGARHIEVAVRALRACQRANRLRMQDASAKQQQHRSDE